MIEVSKKAEDAFIELAIAIREHLNGTNIADFCIKFDVSGRTGAGGNPKFRVSIHRNHWDHKAVEAASVMPALYEFIHREQFAAANQPVALPAPGNEDKATDQEPDEEIPF